MNPRRFRIISALLITTTLILLVAVVIVATSGGDNNSISSSNKTTIFDTGDTFDNYARSTVIQEINLTATTSAIAITQTP
jgi:ABC-type glycerol-3-phosphate transport system permease component